MARSALLLALWLSPSLLAAGSAGVSGVVRDPDGAPLAGARVAIVDAALAEVRSGRTDGSGRFVLAEVPEGAYMLVASVPGLGEARAAVSVGAAGVSDLALVIAPLPAFSERVTVSAEPGRASDVDAVSQAVTLVDEDEIAARAKAVVAQAASEEAGVHLQRTSPTLAGIYVRGLTGNKVSVFVDGVRYSTSSARGGINTFLNLVDPAGLEGIEVLRGPSSAQYGSDAIGGSVHFLTRGPRFSADGPEWHGRLGSFGGSADLSFGADAQAAYSAPRFALVASLAGRRVNTLRPGRGRDSHNAVTRFFGLPSEVVIEDRLPDTAFTQYGGRLKGQWALSPGARLSFGYLRAQQDGGKRYDQLLGGDGNLVADLRNLMLDLAHARYERFGLGWVQRASLAYSWNAQREERVNQGGNGNPRASITHEYEKTRAHGLELQLARAQGRHDLLLGADLSLEGIASPSFAASPATGAVTLRRGRVPDGSRFRSGGIYLQDAFEAMAQRLRLVGVLRWSGASYHARASESPLVGGRPLWPDDALDVSALTFRLGAVLSAPSGLFVTANVSRGFRAPHMTDLGTLGLTGSGFEVAAADLVGSGATIGTTADARATSTGLPVIQVGPETSLSYEAGLRFRGERVETDLAVFVNDLGDGIVKQSLILPPGAFGSAIGGERVVRQEPNGVVFVGASSGPVLVRTNLDAARLFGVEHALDWKIGGPWSLTTAATWIRARDRRTGLPPSIEGGTPAPDAWVTLRYAPHGGQRLRLEAYAHLAERQTRLSSLDLEDRRTGATRSRVSIASFFTNGARARGLVGPGPDGAAGTADDVLLATGETLAQVQARVLGSASSAPLFTAVPGYAVFGLRGVLRFGRSELLVDFENLGDRNYRGISWGVDAPGRSVFARYSARF